MKKLLIAIFAMFCASAHAGQIVNVEYIHKLIQQKHGIEIEYSQQLINPHQTANMEYLLKMVDIANKELNGYTTTEYGTGIYATKQAADTYATIYAVNKLIKGIKYPFHFVPETNGTDFQFMISAAGTFYVDWGDGKTEEIVKTDTAARIISHTYETAANNYNIGLGGRATGYTRDSDFEEFNGTQLVTDTYIPGIAFSPYVRNAAMPVSAIKGCLGCVFPTLADGTQPSFTATFMANSELTDIPAGLFYGISGTTMDAMFFATFAGTTITSIPERMFSGITNVGNGSFIDTFAVTPITSLPSILFPNVRPGTSAGIYAFYGLFAHCENLTGYIPPTLFKNFVPGDDEYRIFEIGWNEVDYVCDPQPDYCYWQDNWEQVCEPQPDICWPEDMGSEICEPQLDYCYWQEDWQEVCDEPDADGNQNCHTEDMGSEVCEPQPDNCYWQEDWQEICEPQSDYCYDENHPQEICEPQPDNCYYKDVIRYTGKPPLMMTSCPVGTKQVKSVWEPYWHGLVACEP